MTDYRKIQPWGDRLLVELLAPAQESSGGILLPDGQQSNTTHARVIAAGPGIQIPDSRQRTLMIARPGLEVLFPAAAFTALVWEPREKLGIVRDGDVVAIVHDKEIIPVNDWVQIRPEVAADRIGSIFLPDDLIRSTNAGRIQDWGNGAMRWDAKAYGNRDSVWRIMGVGADEPMLGRTVHWSDEAEAFSLGSESIETVLVRARDLLFTE